jgi:hypothetical protein
VAGRGFVICTRPGTEAGEKERRVAFRVLAVRLGSIADTPGNTDEERLQHRFLIATGVIMSMGGFVWA